MDDQNLWISLLEDDDFNALTHGQMTNVWNNCVLSHCGLEDKCFKNVPELTELNAVEREIVERLESCCSPEKDAGYSMTFIRGPSEKWLEFPARILLVNAKFDGSQLARDLMLRECQFEGSVSFRDFEAVKVRFDGSTFHCQPFFNRCTFRERASFVNCHFRDGASFSDSEFLDQADFSMSQFYVKRDLSYDFETPCLVDFTKVRFRKRSCFDQARFGAWDPSADPSAFPKRSVRGRYVDFSSATFDEAASFRKTAFIGHPPLFYNTTLHQGSSFIDVNWRQSEALRHPDGKDWVRQKAKFPKPSVPRTLSITLSNVALQAWERLEEVIADLGSHAGRHAVFCSRSRTERPLLPMPTRLLDALYDLFSGYGGRIPRALSWWFFHWGVSAVVLAGFAVCAGRTRDTERVLLSAMGTAFSNAHQFLFLTGEGGYLKEAKDFLASVTPSAAFGTVGVIQAFLGPVFLFLLLLTLRNQFRMR